jgi:hypothetical protein
LADHIPHQPADGHLPIDAGTVSPTLFPQPHAARYSIQPYTDRNQRKTIKRGLRPTRHIAEDLSG